MSEEARRAAVTVVIAGDAYTIRSGAPPDYTRACAEYVDRTVEDVLRKGSLVEAHKAVILAALSITDELFKAREAGAATGRELDGLAGRLADEIDEALAGDDLASPA